MSDEPHPKGRAAPSAQQALPLVQPATMAPGRELRARPQSPRRQRKQVPSVPERAEKPFALVGAPARPPVDPGPCILESRDGRLQLGFAEALGHPSRKGTHITRHMLPWWEPGCCEDVWRMIR